MEYGDGSKDNLWHTVGKIGFQGAQVPAAQPAGLRSVVSHQPFPEGQFANLHASRVTPWETDTTSVQGGFLG